MAAVESPNGDRPIVFMRHGALQFLCKGCTARLTWSRFRTAGRCDCLVDRVNCQDHMMAARCPHCGHLYAKPMNRGQMLPNEALEVSNATTLR